MEIPFTKLHGNGNDFVIIDEYEKIIIPDDMKGQFAAIYCDRRFGIGADGVMFLSKSEKSMLKMRILQPDESEAEMCGNGIRCLAKYAFDAGYTKESCTVETLAGEISVAMGYREEEFSATITMPTPEFDRKDIPATGDGEYKERIGEFDVYAVNTGVPHAVIIVDAIDAIDVEAAAPQIRHHATFEKGANVNFVERTGPDNIRRSPVGPERPLPLQLCTNLDIPAILLMWKPGEGPLPFISKTGQKWKGLQQQFFPGKFHSECSPIGEFIFSMEM
jgi:diaminopimelate epimerase